MSLRLSDHQYRKLLECIQQLQQCRSLEAFPEQANGVLASLIASDSISYNEMVPARDRLVSRLDPMPAGFGDLLQKWQSYAHQHPVVNYVQKTGDGSVHQITDFLSQRQFHALELYQDFYRGLQVEYQMSFSITMQESFFIGMALNRQGARFSETERLMANLLRPHLCEAYLTVVEMGHLRGLVRGLSAAFDESGEAIVFCSAQGVVLNASPKARALLGKYFRWRNGRALPEALAAWAGPRVKERSAWARRPFFHEQAESRLVARLTHDSTLHFATILLHEETLSPAPTALMARGLTRREAEVLGWLARGKSNPEIAKILGVSRLTTKTHVLSILRKLGVENRTAAAALVHHLSPALPPE